MSAPADNVVDEPLSSPSRPPPSSPLHLLEVTVISAQDLHRRRLGRRVRAYAVAWADAGHKLRTGVDLAGGAVPTWNDRFLFRVDGAFLRSDTAAVTVEVRGTGGLGTDPVLGVTRIVVSTFVRPGGAGGRGGPQVAALQLRRPRSLRPQGIVNVAVALLDVARAPPLYGVPGGSPDAVAVKDLVMKSPAASLCKVSEETGVDDGQQARSNPELVGQSGHLDPRGAAVEQRKLELTLERWKAELWPGLKEGRRSGRRRRRRASSCFRGSGDWDR
ncbi:uncharacterized protein LOC8084703 [Sorghum bicolor]|jgi:hypothetical protein|uniref:C2 domain-containing protein n=1 Tax=Sorghum bicolor TaxID=4558 RepID=A0A194YU21_SORBI|nr:uncharacterized protein LOC8084703 [Sorghum bicolor]KXG31345.1 hypothetical protein SORBI_3004G342700 [Sorghum bicolor]|eukprot:XP_021315089.1 uncharacterized protein LOC8084703 [Sorghum bicolor]